jgi:hypothetical protein
MPDVRWRTDGGSRSSAFLLPDQKAGAITLTGRHFNRLARTSA